MMELKMNDSNDWAQDLEDVESFQELVNLINRMPAIVKKELKGEIDEMMMIWR